MAPHLLGGASCLAAAASRGHRSGSHEACHNVGELMEGQGDRVVVKLRAGGGRGSRGRYLAPPEGYSAARIWFVVHDSCAHLIRSDSIGRD